MCVCVCVCVCVCGERKRTQNNQPSKMLFFNL